MYRQRPGWRRGSGPHFQSQQYNHWRKQTTGRRCASALSKRGKKDLKSCSSSHSFVLGAAAVINPGTILLEQQVTNPSWRRSWLCSLGVRRLSQLLPAYSLPLGEARKEADYSKWEEDIMKRPIVQLKRSPRSRHDTISAGLGHTDSAGKGQERKV